MNLDELKQNVEATGEALQAAAEVHNIADAQYRTARTNSYDPTVVQKARDLGINPDNFDSQDVLSAAVDKVEAENTEAQV